jgi:hypothetical protein
MTEATSRVPGQPSSGESAANAATRDTDPARLVPCQHCAEPILAAAQVCKHCGRRVKTAKWVLAIFSVLNGIAARFSVASTGRRRFWFWIGSILLIVTGVGGFALVQRENRQGRAAVAISAAKEILVSERFVSPGSPRYGDVEVVFHRGDVYVVEATSFTRPVSAGDSRARHFLVGLELLDKDEYHYDVGKAVIDLEEMAERNPDRPWKEIKERGLSVATTFALRLKGRR